MIPFWKKTGKHSKPQSAQKRRQNAKPAVPRTAQQSIPMQRMFEDGTCRVKPNYYTRTIQYQDINYQLAQQEDKTAIFEEWCSFLNFFDSSIKFELSFVNMATDSTEFEKSIRIPYQRDGFDDVRAEYSQMLRQQLAKGNNGLTKTKFITFGVEGESMAQVKPRLDHIQNDLLNNFHRLGVQAKPLNGVQRLKLMHDMFNMDGASKFHFDWKDLVKSGLSVKDAIAPTAFAFKNSRTFQLGGIFCAASFLSITASDISDQLLKDFLDMDSSQIVTMHIQSVDQNRAIKTVKRTITELDRSKIEEQKKAIRAGYDIDIIPSDLATYGRDAKALLKELQSQNERMFLVTFLVLNTGRTEQELENNVFQASSIAQKHNCNLCRLDFQQEQGLMSSLPLADCQIEIQRGLTTSSTAIFIPFTTQELYQSGKESLYYGLNALSNNLIMVDAELKGLLSEDEYAAARSSTLNAHYTSPVVIRSIYDAVEKMGFQSGNILEPSMGAGNFFGMLPTSMADSRLYGVELDSITGRIAKKLYPQADITVAGFETTDRRDFYDLAVGNVPFGQYRVNDKAYNKLGFSIHNYFFAKAIDQVRPGGIVAFVTSRYTMDSKDSSARKHIAERADLLGAIRLPNTAFKANAGTEVVSDIIFLQKRDRPIDHEPDWVQLGKTVDGFTINQYFVDHPEMVLGVLSTESTQYGREELTVAPIEGANLADQLAEAVQHIEGQYTEVEVETPDIADVENEKHILPADPEVKNFSYTVVDGEVFYRENSVMTQVELSDTAKGRVTGMVELRQIVNELIQQQLEDYPDEDIKATQERLNAAYDAFTAKYGLLNDRKNGRLFEQDSSYYLLCSLENLDEQGQLKSKAAMFTKRTIRPERTVTSVDTPSEALAVSINESLDATILMVTHDAFSASYANRILFLRDGAIFTEILKGSDSRRVFFEKILNVLTMMGGGVNDVH